MTSPTPAAQGHTHGAQESMLWVNGERQETPGRHVSANDRGLTLADGLFETMRVRNGVVFRLDEHLARLAGGLARCDIPAVPELRAWLTNAVRAWGDDDAGLRVTVTRGAGVGLAPPTEARPTTIVAIGPLPTFHASVYEEGVSAHIASGRRNERATTAGLKTLSYTDSVVALIEARKAGADEALFLDVEGHCCEATASNLFVWASGLLLTPPLSCGVLPGITRATVLELARELGHPLSERIVTVDDLGRAREAFLTSALRGLAPLVRVDRRAIGDGKPGEFTRQLREAYEVLVSRECPR